MAVPKEAAKNCSVITKPGMLAFGTGLPPESTISSCFRDETVVQISCGVDHSAVVCATGRVYTFGKNQYNGWVENNADKVQEPALVPTLSSIRITQVACGFQFTVFLTDKGELYSCGLNNRGQLGLGHTNKCPAPALVSGLPPISKVAAGYEYTVALTDSGDVWATGSNEVGQLGLGREDHSFTRVPDLPDVISDISCGALHTALLSRSGVLLMTGKNNCGQLGLGKIDSLCSFQAVSVSAAGVAAVACGSYHTVALRVDGTTWAWGSNMQDQLGLNDDRINSFFSPMKIVGLEKFTISRVFAGCNRTALLTQDGNMLVCGRGQYGLQVSDKLVPTLLQKAPGLVVQQVALASFYSLMLVVPKPKIETAALQQDGSNVSGSGMLERGCVSDLERSILRSLECPVCMKIMCVPIHMCVRGHSLCNTCRSQSDITVCPLCREAFHAAKNITLESLSADIQLPCTDCFERMPATRLAKHADVCPARTYSCPVQHLCGWSGRPETMLAHTSSAHPDQTWRDLPHLFVHSTADELVHTDFLAAHNEVFTLHRRYKRTEREFQAVMRYVGAPENKHKFSFECAFIMKYGDNMFHRNICPDTENFEDMFQSPNCVSLEQKQLDTYLQQDKLVCQVAVMKEECGGLAVRMKTLLSR